jgi:hypothetical protein
MFNQKGLATLPSPTLTDSHVETFIPTSEALVAQENVHIASDQFKLIGEPL